jgi:hypothetical protein
MTNTVPDVMAAHGWRSFVDLQHSQSPAFGEFDLLVDFKPGALHPVTTATINALTCICFSGLRPEIQATRYAGGR